MSKIILGLTGPIACGKGTIKKYIEEKYGGTDCRFSTILRDVLGRIDISINRENLQKISTALRQTFGEDILAKAIAIDAQKLLGNIVVIDGVRRESDIKYLKNLPGFILVSIDADQKIRHERMCSRNENQGDDKKTFEQFLDDHEAEADKQVPDIMKKAQISINNNGSKEELFLQVDKIIQTYRTA